MKCDELKPIELECNMGKDINGVEHREPWKAYDIDEVDAAIAELKQKLEDAGMRERRLRRALWLTRSRRAFAEARYNNQIAIRYRQHKERTIAECYDKEVIKWKKADSKLRAKAEEYK